MAANYTTSLIGAPTKIKVESLGVGIKDDTREALNMSTTQYLVVGERNVMDANQNVQKSFSLFSDVYGVSINTNSLEREEMIRNRYSMYISGNLFVDGTITTSDGTIVPGSNVGGSNVGVGVGDGDLFWNATSDNQAIYHSGNVVLANKINASVNNSNTFAVIQSANHNINRAQVAVQNLGAAQLRLAILGTARESPAVISTSSNSPFEIHVGREQAYFASSYTHTYIDNFGVHRADVVESPVYTASSNAPHLKIDTHGNVGIHTSTIPTITYPSRYAVPVYDYVHNTVSNRIYLDDKTDTPVLHADGTFYATDIVVRDVDTGTPASLDSLYIRRVGVTLLANQIVPGPFGLGYYNFLSNIAVLGEVEEAFALKVYGSERVTENLVVDNKLTVDRIETNTFVATDVCGFCNDIFANREVTVKESLRLRGGIWTEVPSIDGSNLSWCQVQFMVASPTLSNINYIGQGITTPGRFGAGIDPRNPLDAVNHQMVVVKRSKDIFEMELKDRSISGLTRAIFIGHPDNSEIPNDGSTVIATPQAMDLRYNTAYRTAGGVNQNIYMYPGADLSPAGGLILTSNNPPPLGVYARTGYVGIGTFSPVQKLHVEGSIFVSSNVTIANPYDGELVTMGVWQTITSPLTTLNSNVYFDSIAYLNPNAPHVGINTLADHAYGLNIAGGLRADQYYSSDEKLVSLWYDTPTGSNVVGAAGAYTTAFVGIGHSAPEVSLDVKAVVGESAVRIRASDFTDTSVLEFQNPGTMWSVETSKTYGSLSVYDASYGPSNANANGTKAIWCGVNASSKKYQVAIGCSETDRTSQAINPDTSAALTVKGNLVVIGDVNTTGFYKANGQIALNPIMASNIPIPVLDTNDVFIGGADIFINPMSTGPGDPYTQRIVAIGYTDDLRQRQMHDTSIFRVFSQTDVIARFCSQGPTGLIQVSDYYSDKGIQFGFLANNDFGFLDMIGRPYLTFKNVEFDENLIPISDKKVGINTTAPTAMVHAYTELSGRDMVKMTKFTTADQSGVAPEMSLEKLVSVNNGSETNSYSWILHGPESSFQQKCAFIYSDPHTDRKEVMCVTPAGCLGVGTTNPVYGVDVTGPGQQGSMRLYSTFDTSASNIAPAPQLVIQSGDPTFGADGLTDYRIYAYNSNFMIESQALNSTSTILFVDSQNHVGIGTSVVDAFTLTVGGKLNVQNAIYINGSPVFSATGQTNNIVGTNITISPDITVGGGVQINNPDVILTSNVFTVFSGNDAVVSVFDSVYQESQVAWRNVDDDLSRRVYRLNANRNEFQLEYNPNVANQTVEATHTGYGVAWSVAPKDTGLSDFTFNVKGDIQVASTATYTTPSIIIGASSLVDVNASGNLYIRSSNVGVGTQAPRATLEVNSAGMLNYNSNLQDIQDILCVGNGTSSHMTVSSAGLVSVTSNLAVGELFTAEKLSTFQGDVSMQTNLVVEHDARVKGYFTNDSDRRLKTDFQKITGALEKVCSLEGVTYAPINEPHSGEDRLRRVGLIAQDVQRVFPEAVVENEDGYLSIAYGNLVGALVEAIKELNAKLDQR
jgi:hypothetical protein